LKTLSQERVQELNLRLKESNKLRESDILINEIDTLESVLGRLSDLKYGDKTRAIEIAEVNTRIPNHAALHREPHYYRSIIDGTIFYSFSSEILLKMIA
jgi:hypothetical protein